MKTLTLIEKAAQQARIETLIRHRKIKADEEYRRITCNRIARILRRLGVEDAKADQSDTGRRDVTGTINGYKFFVSVFDGENQIIKALEPQICRHFRSPSDAWIRIDSDLRNLPSVVFQIAKVVTQYPHATR